ncbi:MAG: pyrroloquinoline quinone-dependent dehydrogenase, partial [Bacteroidota bacterium]
MNRYNLFFFPLIAALVWYACTPSASSFAIEQPENWPVYGGLGSNQYSALNQINRDNVQQLELAWQFNSGDKDPQNRTQIQCNPLIVDGMLFGSTPTVKFFALNGATGQEIWRFDPFDGAYDQFGMGVNRGVAYWSDGQEARLLCSAADYLYCLDAKTGSLMADFGEGGKLNLRLGLGEDAQERFVSGNTPGVVYKDLLIMGMRVSEGTDAAPGFIRAFDVKTGALVWTFHTIPRPGEFGHVTWPEDAWQRVGGANSWAGVTLDEQRGIVYVPTGSASYDFYGGNRHGDNLFANCVLALDATTGERIWHYQTIHHDLWDRDLPAAPNLVRVTHNGQKKDAVAQITKHGYVFLLDRETGEPLFEVQEVPAPASSLPGELAAETQPLPVKPPPFSRQTLDADNVTNLSPEVRQWALDSLTKINPDTDFLPPSREGTIIFPGFDGGGEWGGA